jgi:LuxR family transcriptional regulator, maltose regulon positive regulatory protein
MIMPILTTKLNKPQLSDHMISRESLLKDCDWASIILVSAQAGSGKSTVVNAWLSEQSKAYCWYALDEWDNDLMQFFAYLIAGIKPIDAVASEALKQLFDAYQSVGFEAFLRALINQLHAIKSPYILILDDYHVIRNDQIHQLIRTMLEHFPPSMQLVLITREDPPFPLAKMRAAKKLFELRISQLRFTEAEVKAYFSQQLQISLEEDEIQHIITRTEGWIAGLQMTALSMQGIDDIGGFIKTFSGSHYYIMDYLMEEVLERQAPEIKAFLLRTSILEFFSDDLCDTVVQLETGTSNTIIKRLVKTNSFIISTESSYKWFRYHHLFRDLLRHRLEQESMSELESLHRRAGLWLKTYGFGKEALHHLIKANAFEEAAALIECKWAEMDSQLQSASWLEMAQRLPSTILERSPILTMGYGWALLDMGDVEACAEWFDKALRLYNLCQTDGRPEDIIINDKTQFDLLPATIASAYAYIAGAAGDIEGVFTHTRYALERIPSDQYIMLGVANMLLGFAHWGSGDLHEAESVIVRSLKNIKRAANPLVENSYCMVLGELYIQQDALSKAKSMFELTISRVIKEDLVTIFLPSLYLGLAKIAFLQSENKQAYALLEESKTHGQRYALMDWKYKYYLLLARIYCSEGLYDLARDCINESRMHYYINPIPEEIKIDDVEMQVDAAAAHHRPGKLLRVKDENEPAFKKEHVNQSLPEPLTVRELEVLSLIASGLSNQEICDRLFLALNTVKGYNQNIIGKLEVNRRTQAVAKAIELGLV